MSVARLLVLLSLLAPTAGCDSDPPPREKVELERQTAQVRAFERRLSTIVQAVPKEPSPCPDGTIRSAIARSQNRRVLFADTKSLTASAGGKLAEKSSPLTFLVSPALMKRTESAQVIDQKTATEAAFAVVELKKRYDFLAALAFTFKPPRAEGEKFHAGELRGMLALFDLESGQALCALDVSADSSLEAVKKPGQSRQEAADKDFELQLRRALEHTFSLMTDELVLELS